MPKTDLIHMATALQSALISACDAARPALSKKGHAAIQAATDSVNQALAHLRALEDFINLGAIDSTSSALRDHLAHWDTLPSGLLHRNDDLLGLRAHSLSLRQMHRYGITVTGLTKFTPSELQSATEIGRHLKDFENAFHAMKYGLSRYVKDSHHVTWGFPVIAQKSTLALADRLTRLGFISGATYFHRDNADVWHEINQEDITRLSCPFVPYSDARDYVLRIQLNGFDPQSLNFLTGHWLEAYAYSLFRDQLDRLDIDFEIYTQVAYSADMPDGGESVSDLDILVCTGDALALVECKTGKLQLTDRDTLIQKTHLMKQAFSGSGITQFLPVMVYSPRGAANEKIVRELQDHTIICLQPHELRGFIIDRLASASLDTAHGSHPSFPSR